MYPLSIKLHQTKASKKPAVSRTCGLIKLNQTIKFATKYKIRTYDPIRVKDVLYH